MKRVRRYKKILFTFLFFLTLSFVFVFAIIPVIFAEIFGNVLGFNNSAPYPDAFPSYPMGALVAVDTYVRVDAIGAPANFDVRRYCNVPKACFLDRSLLFVAPNNPFEPVTFYDDTVDYGLPPPIVFLGNPAAEITIPTTESLFDNELHVVGEFNKHVLLLEGSTQIMSARCFDAFNYKYLSYSFNADKDGEVDPGNELHIFNFPLDLEIISHIYSFECNLVSLWKNKSD
jgi:hypothetical protein